MAGLFVGKTGLRAQYFEATAADFNTAVDAASAFCVARTQQPCRLGLLNNGTSANMVILVCSPEADPSLPQYRLKLIELPANTPLNIDTSFGANLAIDPGTWFFAYPSMGTVQANEKLRIFFWG